MQVRWTDSAVNDLQDMVDFIALASPAAAQRIAHAIFLECESLSTLPERGRPGIEAGTRELILVPSGHIITYEIRRDAVFILRIHHGAQDWPRR